MTSPYYTNPSIKSQIDIILKRASVMMANIGTKTPLDVGTREDAKRIEREWLNEVKELDLEMYQSIVPQEEVVK